MNGLDLTDENIEGEEFKQEHAENLFQYNNQSIKEFDDLENENLIKE
jgi:hypothetical protein